MMNEREASIISKAVAAECIAHRVRLLNRVVTNIYDKAMRPLGLKVNQANILNFLLYTGPTTSADISRMLSMEKSTVSRTVERMRKNGWISVAGCGDGPSQLISVTPGGRKLMKSVYVAWQKAQREASLLLGEDGMAAVRKLHEKMKKKK